MTRLNEHVLVAQDSKQQQKTQLLINEIFGATIQGEGALIGQQTVFVRTAGCDYRCTWCDTLYAVDPVHKPTWYKMSSAAVFSEVENLTQGHPILITLSGGNPALQDFNELITLGQAKGYRFAMETQGSAIPDYLSRLDYLTISPKPPSSQEATDWEKLDACIDIAPQQAHLKVVIADEADYQYARQVAARYPQLPLTLQPCNLNTDDEESADIEALNNQLKWIMQRCQQDHWYTPTLLPQLHVLLWNNERAV